MNELSNRARAMAVVLEADPDVAAVLSLQLDVLGMESRYYSHSSLLLNDILRRQPQLVIMGLELGADDSISLLRRLGECHYRGSVLLLSGVEAKITRIAERVGETLGLNMLGSLDKPMRMVDLRQCLDSVGVGRERPIETCREPVFTCDELEHALHAGELTLHYQPQFELSSGRLSGVEALVRWAHPELGLIGPGNFLPLLSLEQSKRLTSHVLTQAQYDAAQWARAGVTPTLSVNVTADDMMSPDLLALTRMRSPGDPSLVLEITETAAMDDELLGSEVAARLCLSGLEMSVDDFGIGFSSLARLQSLPISELKIDRSFVRLVQQEAQSAAIVEAVALLGRRMGIRVVAEGVEDMACLPLLERFGCTHVQGFGLARPMPAPDILALGTHHEAIRASSAGTGLPVGSVP